MTSARVAVLCAHIMPTSQYTVRYVSRVFEYRHFVNKVSGQHFAAENKQEAAECYFQHLLVHSRGVMWKIKSKSNFLVSFSLNSAEMNLVGNYRTLRGLQTVNPEGLPSTSPKSDIGRAEKSHKGQNATLEYYNDTTMTDIEISIFILSRWN